MLKSILDRARRLVVVAREYEYTYDISDHTSAYDPDPADPDFFLLTRPEEANTYTWENGEHEARSVRKLLSEGEVVGILHREGVVHARLALRTNGWVSTAAQRRYRRLREGEGYFHFMRTAKFARGNGYQVKIHGPYYQTDTVKRLNSLTSTCNVSNIASIKGIERSGGIRVKRVVSIGLIGGRIGFSIELPLNGRPTSEL